MPGLIYREDIDEVRRRLTKWWNGANIGRPVMHIYVPRPKPLLDIKPRPKPPGWNTNYSTKDFNYRVYLSEIACNRTIYMGEAMPFVSPDLAPGCLALYLGCTCVEQTDTVWFQPCMKGRVEPDYRYDPNNFYWQFTLRLAHEQLRIGKDKFILQFPDLIEGLDTLAALRGSENLLTDVIEDPDWIQRCLRQITDRYFHYYDILYDLIRDDAGGSYFWIWAPGRMAKFQCDFSAMIGPEMFRDFMVPVLREMCQRVSYSLYHWDGPGALPHFEHILGIEELDMIQWVPGDGNELPDHPRWWHLYHRMLERDKKVYIHYCPSSESLKALKKEFRKKLNQFFIIMHIKTVEEAEELLKIASD